MVAAHATSKEVDRRNGRSGVDPFRQNFGQGFQFVVHDDLGHRLSPRSGASRRCLAGGCQVIPRWLAVVGVGGCGGQVLLF
jgi:hypothetical protein